jgi:hypothetical protein
MNRTVAQMAQILGVNGEHVKTLAWTFESRNISAERS